MTEERGTFRTFEHDGEIVLANDDERTHCPLSDVGIGGYRYAYVVCCDCGLTHEYAVKDDHFIAVRAPEDVAEKIRASTREKDPSYFPLRQRYRLVGDNDGHDYVIPVEKSDEWEAFTEIPSDDERSWQVPEWARYIEGGLTFTDPQS